MAAQTTLEERLQIMERSAAGEAAWRIAHDLGWRVSTIRKWRQRGQRLGRAGLVAVMGRPAQGALSSFGTDLPARVRQLRQAHPGWGPQTLRAELQREASWVGQHLPSPAAIGRFLKAEGLTEPPQRHSDLPPVSHGEPGSAHALWEMDARGYRAVPEVGVVTLIDLNDRVSHVRLLSYPCRLGAQRASRHVMTADYQAALRLAFLHWGLPQALQVDHESAFYDNRSPSPFPTLLHLWLLALGVELTFSRVRRPTDQAMTERSHQLWSAQVLQGQRFADWHDLYHTLQQRRDFLNYDLPCRTLDQRPPLVAHPEAVHSGRTYSLASEAHLLDLQRVYRYLAQGRWFRLVNANATISLGAQLYYIGPPWRRQQLEITFDPTTLHLHFADKTGQLIHQAPLHGISLATLMGDWQTYATSPAFQLNLPFTWADQRLLRLCEIAT